MTQDDVCEWLLRNAAKEYNDAMRSEGVRCFYLPRMADVPNCGCNQRPPSLHIIVYPDLWMRNVRGVHEGTVEFEVVGRAGDDRWLRATIYGCKRDEVPLVIGDAEYAAKRIWTEFSNVMNAIRPQPERDDD